MQRRGSILLLAQALAGSFGLAILVLSVAARLSLLPLTIHLALRAQARQRGFAQLQESVPAIEKRSGNTTKAKEEINALYREHLPASFNKGDIVGTLVQMPLFGGLYRAIAAGSGAGRSFGWIADLAHPDALLGALAGSITFLALSLGDGKGSGKWFAATASALMIVFIVRRMAAGLGLYWVSSGVVSIVQAVWLRRRIAAAR